MKRYFVILLCTYLSLSTISAQYIKPSDVKATKKTCRLYKNLWDKTSDGIMIGHQDALAYGVGWYNIENKCDVKDASGYYPAVFGWELGGIEYGKSHNLDSVSFEKMRTYAFNVYKMGALNTFSWHMGNIFTGKSAWDVSSDKVVESILPSGSKHEQYKLWLNHIAVFFLSLRDEKGNQIPVIFRPFHEHTGSWFWWGKNLCSESQYKQLFRFTIDYLRRTKKVHNLLIAYSSGDIKTDSDFINRYPGDQYVDIVGFDHYQYGIDSEVKSKFITSIRSELEFVSQFAKSHKKIPALTETGCETLGDSTWFSSTLSECIKGYKISYVLLWRNAFNKKNHFYMPYPGHSSVSDFKKFISTPNILMQNNTGNLYK